jgi:hypothetical protein
VLSARQLLDARVQLLLPGGGRVQPQQGALLAVVLGLESVPPLFCPKVVRYFPPGPVLAGLGSVVLCLARCRLDRGSPSCRIK